VIDIDFKKGDGLVPVIVQDHETGEVLMLAYMNDLSWKKTLETGKATYWSRSRNELWVKGETSGHVQLVKEILVDCDADTLLLKVSQVGGAACHTGYRSCFYRRVSNETTEVIGELVFKPEDVYK
jgi:phosphoribosyl-AMP cyclohydrolase